MTGVNAFVLIAGYFGISKKQIKMKKIINILLILVYYGVLIFILSLLGGIADLSTNSFYVLFKSIFDRWFVDIYIALYLLTPFINKLVSQLKQDLYKYLLIILFVAFSIWPSFVSTIMISDYGYGIVQFVMLYLIGGYINLYMDDYLPKKSCLLAVFSISWLLVVLFSRYALPTMEVSYAYNFSLNILNAVLLLFFFKTTRCRWLNTYRQVNIIRYLAGCSLSVYIIHENPFISRWIFRTIFNTESFFDDILMPVHFFATIVAIYWACVVIEWPRGKLFSLFFNSKLEKSKIANRVFEIS